MLSQTKQPAMTKLPFILLIFISVSVCSQDRSKFLYAEFSDLSITLWPLYKPFGSNFDPALTLGGGIEYREKKKTMLFQTAQLTGYTTEIMGQGFNLTTSIGYQYNLSSGIFAEGLLGVGASFFFPVRETFVQDDNDNYVAAKPIRFISSVPMDIILGYKTGKYSLYLKYRYMMQGPYTEIMPALPTSLTGIGIRYNIQSSSK